jgi:putative transposase
MPYWKCYYHVVWATKYRQPIIIPAYEKVIVAAIEEKCKEQGVALLAANMVSDHVHIGVAIPPSMSVAKFVGSVKGAAARAINTSFERDTKFHWQGGYGVMSFGETALDKVKEYIANQKQRHANSDLNSYLENVGDED